MVSWLVGTYQQVLFLNLTCKWVWRNLARCHVTALSSDIFGGKCWLLPTGNYSMAVRLVCTHISPATHLTYVECLVFKLLPGNSCVHALLLDFLFSFYRPYYISLIFLSFGISSKIISTPFWKISSLFTALLVAWWIVLCHINNDALMKKPFLNIISSSYEIKKSYPELAK